MDFPLPKFDELKQTAFHHILDVGGERAVWIKSDGEKEDGRVLFRDPTKDESIGQSDTYTFKSDTPIAEWYKDTFIGLKELADRQEPEHLVIRGRRYFITTVETLSDGDTYVANLQLVNE